jgi:hypothetical protein
MLKTEQNTPAIEKKMLASARATLGKRNLSAFFEHGQWFVEHRPSGAQWSACDAEGPTVIGGFVFEQVTEGDE